MKKGKIFFHPIDGSASLTISWSLVPKGDAVEAKNGEGVGFFSDTGDLLCVIFGEVQADQDQQILQFDRYLVKITVKNGKVAYDVSDTQSESLTRHKRIKHRRLLNS
ncbi:MAG: hypothetical protein JSS10_09290 [Verrucomicrobia bacterium]|nr:hypothetical protein [Verrucomicrobiota bacterium]